MGLTRNQKISRISVEERVDNGWNWLEENFPGWQKRIKVNSLNLESGIQCICGQVFAKEAAKVETRWVTSGYDYAVEHLFDQASRRIPALVGTRGPRCGLASIALGFLAISDTSNDRADIEQNDWDALQAEWLRRIWEWRKAQRAT